MIIGKNNEYVNENEASFEDLKYWFENYVVPVAGEEGTKAIRYFSYINKDVEFTSEQFDGFVIENMLITYWSNRINGNNINKKDIMKIIKEIPKQ